MIATLLLPHLTKIGIVIDFKINQDFIAKARCINKEKPMLRCGGKCYLSKQLKKTEEQGEKKVPLSKNEKNQILYYYIQGSLTFLKDNAICCDKLRLMALQEFFSSSFIADIFHPPKLI